MPSRGQLLYKLANTGTRAFIPLTAVSLRGIRIVHAAQISGRGHTAYAALADKERGSPATVYALADEEQLARIEETEPNYWLSTVSSDLTQATLESGQVLHTFSLFRARWGCISGRTSNAPCERNNAGSHVLYPRRSAMV